MGRTVAYIATAILLGLVAMLPVMIFTPKEIDLSYYAIERDTPLLFKGDFERVPSREEFGTAVIPLSPFNLGLILVVSSVFAFGVSFYYRRRML